jgi:hypothetical protein
VRSEIAGTFPEPPSNASKQDLGAWNRMVARSVRQAVAGGPSIGVLVKRYGKSPGELRAIEAGFRKQKRERAA